MSRAAIIAETVATRIIGERVYVISGTPVEMGQFDGCYFPRLAQAFRPRLEAQGRWRGDGVGVLVADTIPGVDPDDYERSIVGLVLHELAHWLDRPAETEPAPEPAECYAAFVVGCQLQREQWEKPQPIHPALAKHAAQFIRACAHLWYRADHGGGYCLRAEWLGFGSQYPGLEALSSPARYVETLYDECQRGQYTPIREILATEKPPAFAAQWSQDLDRVFQTALAAA